MNKTDEKVIKITRDYTLDHLLEEVGNDRGFTMLANPKTNKIARCLAEYLIDEVVDQEYGGDFAAYMKDVELGRPTISIKITKEFNEQN